MNFKYLNLHFMKEELEFFLGSLIITAEYTPLNLCRDQFTEAGWIPLKLWFRRGVVASLHTR